MKPVPDRSIYCTLFTATQRHTMVTKPLIYKQRSLKPSAKFSDFMTPSLVTVKFMQPPLPLSAFP